MKSKAPQKLNIPQLQRIKTIYVNGCSHEISCIDNVYQLQELVQMNSSKYKHEALFYISKQKQLPQTAILDNDERLIFEIGMKYLNEKQASNLSEFLSPLCDKYMANNDADELDFDVLPDYIQVRLYNKLLQLFGNTNYLNLILELQMPIPPPSYQNHFFQSYKQMMETNPDQAHESFAIYIKQQEPLQTSQIIRWEHIETITTAMNEYLQGKLILSDEDLEHCLENLARTHYQQMMIDNDDDDENDDDIMNNDNDDDDENDDDIMNNDNDDTPEQLVLDWCKLDLHEKKTIYNKILSALQNQPLTIKEENENINVILNQLNTDNDSKLRQKFIEYVMGQEARTNNNNLDNTQRGVLQAMLKYLDYDHKQEMSLLFEGYEMSLLFQDYDDNNRQQQIFNKALQFIKMENTIIGYYQGGNTKYDLFKDKKGIYYKLKSFQHCALKRYLDCNDDWNNVFFK